MMSSAATKRFSRWLDWGKRSFTRLRRPETGYRLAVIAIVVFGVVLRLNGYLFGETIGIWLDEAFWAGRVLKEPVMKLASFRPLGFVWVSKALITRFGPTEFWLRLLSVVASIAALGLMPYVARRLFKLRWLALLVLFAFAVHPSIIDLAKEFKPYSCEVFCHLLPLALYLRYHETRRPAYLYVLAALLPLLFLFAYNMVVLLPAILLLIVWRAVRDFRPRWIASVPVVLLASLGALACLGWLVKAHSIGMKRNTSGQSISYWSRKYDVFYTKKFSEEKYGTRVAWTTKRYCDVAAIPGVRRERWEFPDSITPDFAKELKAGERLVWVVLHLLGLVFLAHRRRYEEAMLLLSPLAIMVVINYLGKWPLGSFRTNLYAVPYTLLLAGYGIAHLVGRRRQFALPVAGAVAVFLLATTFSFGFDWHSNKGTWAPANKFPTVIRVLRERREAELHGQPSKQRRRLIAETHSVHAYRYYTKVHPTLSKRHGDFFRKNFALEAAWGNTSDMRRRIAKRAKASKEPFWVLVSKRSHMEPARESVRRVGRIIHEEYISPDHLLIIAEGR